MDCGLSVLVVPQWSAFKKLIQGRTPAVAEAGFVDRADPLEFMDYFRFFDQIAILKPAPIDQTLSAISYVLPLILREKFLDPEGTPFGIAPCLAGRNHSCMSHHMAVERIFRGGGKIVGVFSAIRTLNEGDNFGGSLTPIAEANRESEMFRNPRWEDGVGIRLGSNRDVNKEPRALGIDRRFGAASCGIGGVSRYVGGYSDQYGLPDQYADAGKDPHNADYGGYEVAAIQRVLCGVVGMVSFVLCCWFYFVAAPGGDSWRRLCGFFLLGAFCFFLSIPFLDTGLCSRHWIRLLESSWR